MPQLRALPSRATVQIYPMNADSMQPGATMNTPRQQRTTASGRRQGSTTQWLGYCRRDNHGGALGLDNATLIKNIEASRPCTRALCTQQYRTSRSRTGFPWRRRTPRRQKMAGRDPRTTSPSRSRQPSAPRRTTRFLHTAHRPRKPASSPSPYIAVVPPPSSAALSPSATGALELRLADATSAPA